MMERKYAAIVVVIVAVGSVSGLALIFGNPISNQVPPPDNPPGSDIEITSTGDIDVFAEAVYWQDFMPGDDPDNPFYTVVTVNITNNGDSTIEYVSAIRTTIYYNATTTPFVTLELIQAYQTLVPITVSPGESVVIEYKNDPNTVFSPSIDEGTALYSRILFRWIDNSHEAILTTSPVELFFTH